MTLHITPHTSSHTTPCTYTLTLHTHTHISKQTIYAAYKPQAPWNLLWWTQVSPGLPSTLTRDRLRQDKRNWTLPRASAQMRAENLSGPWGRVSPDLRGCGRLVPYLRSCGYALQRRDSVTDPICALSPAPLHTPPSSQGSAAVRELG